MDISTGKVYATREEAIADGVDPANLVEIPPPRRFRRGKTFRERVIENRAANQVSPHEKSRKAAARRVQKQSRRNNRKKK